jgi:hypothetical protein
VLSELVSLTAMLRRVGSIGRGQSQSNSAKAASAKAIDGQARFIAL